MKLDRLTAMLSTRTIFLRRIFHVLGDGGKSEIQKFEHLENEKNFLDVTFSKKHFS